MNVTVENLAPCKKLLRIEIDIESVDKAFEEMTRDFQKQASLPGFRPGKAPRSMIEKRYASDIETEVKRKLIPDAFQTAVKEQKLSVITRPDIEEIQFGRGQPLLFAATVETAPEFELPEYRGLPVKKERASVTDEDVERALNLLREQRVDYKLVERPAAAGDLVVVNYAGRSEGKPLTEFAPTARGLTEQKNFWVQTDTQSFIPGFGEQLIGATAGEKRTIHVEFPADFVAKDLSGRKAVYEVDVLEVRESAVPELNEEFARTLGAESVEKLRGGVRRDLENELKFTQQNNARKQIVTALLDRVSFELPEAAVAHETRNVVYSIVQENQRRGISNEVIDQQREAIFGAANSTAKDRVKAGFLFRKIAEKEGIKVENEDVLHRIHQLAATYEMKPEQFLKDLKQRNGIPEVFDQVQSEKVLNWLLAHATVEEVDPAPKPQ